MTEQERLNAVNELIKVIASCGRRFFSENSDNHGKPIENAFVSFMEVDKRGKVWFTDYYTRKRIYTHYRYDWKGFTSGGTLRDLVCVFREFIKRGTTMNKRYFNTSELYCSGHPWGYGDELTEVKDAAIKLGIAQ